MNENKNLQPEPISPEDQLDQLLEHFLAQPDMELPEPQEDPDALQEDIPVWEAPIVMEAPEDPIVAETPASEPEIAEAEVSGTDTPEQLPEETPMPEQSLPEAQPSQASDEQIAPFEDTWIGEFMDVPIVTEEIGADESAVAAAGLVHPEDQEFVDILQEVSQEQLPQEAQVLQEPSTPLEISDLPEAEQLPQQTPHQETKEPEEMANNTPAGDIPEVPAAEEEHRPLKKIRPKKKGTYGFFSLPHLATTVIWLAIIVFIGVSLGNILWEYAADMLAFGREDSIVTLTIAETDDLDDICDKLQSAGLIKYPSLFKLYAGLSDAMEDINPGTYKLNTMYDYNALVDQMSAYAARVTTAVTIPEGYNCAQIFQLLENKGVTTVSALQTAAANLNAGDYWFLEGVSKDGDAWLEGYLFPDTYTFYLNHDPAGVLDKLLDNFDRRLTESMRDKLPILNETLSNMMRSNGLSEAYIAEHQLTMRDIVIIASMIEKEAAHSTEGYAIASVIYNRLANPNVHPCLQIDATLVYVTGHSVLTAEDLALDSPYNTYKYPGLIPGPIANPSQASLSAALDPDSTPYYYYALNPATGEHKFSETLSEHEAFLESLRSNEE